MANDTKNNEYPAEQGYPRNQWYVAAFSSEVGNGALLSRRLLDVPVVLYRTETGEPVALNDRCPHRGLPLSMGKQVGDLVECGYHGIQFDKDGHCALVPSQTGTPASMSVAHYPVVEKWQWIWIWIGDAKKADPALIPDHDWLGLTREGYHPQKFGMVEMRANYQFLHDNLLDTSHLSYLHTGVLDKGDAALSKPWLEEEGRIIKFGRDMQGLKFEGQMAKYFHVAEGSVYDRRLVTETFAPSITFGRQTLIDPADPSATPVDYYAINALTPASKTLTYVFHAKVTSYPMEWQPKQFEFALEVLEQDKVAIEAIQRRYDEYGDTEERSIRADTAGVLCRRMINGMIKSETIGG